MKITAGKGEKSYPVIIGRGVLKEATKYISSVFDGSRIIIVSDDNVFPLYGEILIHALSLYDCAYVVLPHGEHSKSLKTLPGIYSAMANLGMTRSDLVIALGGGVVGDIAGFAAATFLRGVNLIQIPTSLLAQVDSSIGGKTAVDLPAGKNLVGAFYDPKAVVIDPDVLCTLPKRFAIDGMAEVIKYACVFDRELFELLSRAGTFEKLESGLTDVIYRCVSLKLRTVEKDPFDLGERMLLNFGHTLGHAIEQYFRYERLSHGEAVSVGMYQITKLSEDRRLTAKGTAEKLYAMLKSYGLPTKCGLSTDALSKAVALDKKRLNGRSHFVILKCIGEGFIYQSPPDFFNV